MCIRDALNPLSPKNRQTSATTTNSTRNPNHPNQPTNQLGPKFTSSLISELTTHLLSTQQPLIPKFGASSTLSFQLSPPERTTFLGSVICARIRLSPTNLQKPSQPSSPLRQNKNIRKLNPKHLKTYKLDVPQNHSKGVQVLHPLLHFPTTSDL